MNFLIKEFYMLRKGARDTVLIADISVHSLLRHVKSNSLIRLLQLQKNNEKY